MQLVEVFRSHPLTCRVFEEKTKKILQKNLPYTCEACRQYECACVSGAYNGRWTAASAADNPTSRSGTHLPPTERDRQTARVVAVAADSSPPPRRRGRHLADTTWRRWREPTPRAWPARRGCRTTCCRIRSTGSSVSLRRKLNYRQVTQDAATCRRSFSTWPIDFYFSSANYTICSAVFHLKDLSPSKTITRRTLTMIHGPIPDLNLLLRTKSK